MVGEVVGTGWKVEWSHRFGFCGVWYLAVLVEVVTWWLTNHVVVAGCEGGMRVEVVVEWFGVPVVQNGVVVITVTIVVVVDLVVVVERGPVVVAGEEVAQQESKRREHP